MNVLRNSLLQAGSNVIGDQNLIEYRQKVYGRTDIMTDYDIWKTNSPDDKTTWWYCDTYDAYRHSYAEGLPILYLENDDSVRANELYSVLKAHMETETIKFITGSRDLSELDAYFKELDELGYQEYIGYYQDAYAIYLSNLK